MAKVFDTTFGEGQSIMNPSMFDSLNYSQWRIRMKAFIMAHDME